MHPNAELIQRFYSAFASGDHVAMGASYREDATFSDPVFEHLDAADVRAMWRMFCTSGNEIELSYSDVQADDREGSAHWEAIYSFPATGRRVHNRIDARFTFTDGLISSHVDSFDLYAWTRMALGPLGTLLGWSPIVRNKVRSQALTQLRRFRERETREATAG